MTPLSDIGQRLIDARITRGLSQRGLADLLGIHQQQVARWERERYGCVSLSRLARVAEVLDVEVSFGMPTDAQESQLPLAAEAPAAYGAATADAPVTPVRDLGEVIARIRAHADELHERFGVTHIDVFGSFARGEQTADSDVDLIVEVETPTLESVFGPEEFLTELLNRKADIGSFASLRPRVRPYVERERVHAWRA